MFCSCTFATVEYLLSHMPITPVFFLSICTLHSWFCCKLWLIPDINPFVNPFDCFGFPLVCLHLLCHALYLLWMDFHPYVYIYIHRVCFLFKAFKMQNLQCECGVKISKQIIHISFRGLLLFQVSLSLSDMLLATGQALIHNLLLCPFVIHFEFCFSWLGLGFSLFVLPFPLCQVLCLMKLSRFHHLEGTLYGKSTCSFVGGILCLIWA